MRYKGMECGKWRRYLVASQGRGRYNVQVGRAYCRTRCAKRRALQRSDTQKLLGDNYEYEPQIVLDYFQARPHLVAKRVAEIGKAIVKSIVLLTFNRRKQEIRGVRELIESLGPVFLKMAQTLSTRPDLIGQDIANEFSTLQDRAKAFPSEEAFHIIEEELGKPLSQIFDYIEDEPIAAASLGQVYKATLADGRQVAVKVQRPNLIPRIAVDIFILRSMLSILKRAAKMTRELQEIADEIGTGLYQEVNYIQEAKNAMSFAEAHKYLDYIVVPKPYMPYTSQKVLTMEWIDGNSPANLFSKMEIDSKAKNEVIEMVNMGVACSLNQLLKSGVMHADPHPGNLLYTDDGRIAYLDFGLLTRVPEKHSKGMLSSILHMSTGDWEGFVLDMDCMDLLKPDTDKDALSKDFEKSMKKSPLVNFKRLLKVMAKLGLKYKFALPPYYVLVVRSLATLEGIALKMDNKYDIVSAAARFVRSPPGEPSLQKKCSALLTEVVLKLYLWCNKIWYYIRKWYSSKINYILMNN